MSHLDGIRHTLQHESALKKAVTLVTISQLREVPDDIVALAGSLREDRTVTRMFIPFCYGELGYLAAQVYAYLQFRRGVMEPVTLRETVVPIKGERAMLICEQNGIDFDLDEPSGWFAALRSRGLLITEDVTFDERSFDLDE